MKDSKQKYLIISDNSYDANDIAYVDDIESLKEHLQSKDYGRRYQVDISDIEVYVVDKQLSIEELLVIRGNT